MASDDSGLEVVSDPRSIPECYERQDPTPLQHDLYQKEIVQKASSAAYQVCDHDGTQYRTGRHRIYGVRPIVFGCVTAIITAVIVRVPIGAGLGATLARESSSTACTTEANLTSSATTTSMPPAETTTGGQLVDYIVAPPDTVNKVPLDCPNLEASTYTTFNAQAWSVSCQRGAYSGDFVAVLAYNYTDCIETCASANVIARNSSSCAAVQFDAAIANNSAEDRWGNCYLKAAGACWRPQYNEFGLSAYLLGNPLAECRQTPGGGWTTP